MTAACKVCHVHVDVEWLSRRTVFGLDVATVPTPRKVAQTSVLQIQQRFSTLVMKPNKCVQRSTLLSALISSRRISGLRFSASCCSTVRGSEAALLQRSAEATRQLLVSRFSWVNSRKGRPAGGQLNALDVVQVLARTDFSERCRFCDQWIIHCR